MRKIAVIGNETIHIGRRGENQAIQIVWTNILENWRTMYGEGVVQLAVRRPKDTAPYPVACEVSGNDVMWTIQSADTAQSGVGECELSYIVDAVLVKSQTWNTMIARSLTGAGTVEPPSEPAKTWFTKIQTEIGNLEDLETGDKSNLVAAINEVAQSVGTSDHTKLENRDADDQHPMSAITGLTDALAGKQPTGNYLTQDDLQDATDKALAQAKASGEFDGATGPAGAPGKDGTSGADGVTPHIGDNGNWYLGETDTGKPSRGADGVTGATGATGEKGADGKSAYQYAQEGGYTGTEAEFAAKLAEELPDKLPNPNALTFTGAVTGSYDGSAALSVEIPSGGGSSDAWETIIDTVLEQDTGSVSFSVDASGNPFSLKEFTVFLVQPPIVGQTTNNRIEFAPNGNAWGYGGNVALKSSPKETEQTVYSFIHANTVDGRMNLLTALVSSNYSSVRGSLVEAQARNDYEGNFCLKVNTNTNKIKYCKMPLTKIGFVGITSTMFGAGTRILLRGIRQ